MGELELASYLCCAPVGATDEDLPDPVAGPRRAIEECFQTAWTESGLENYQVRRYDAWYGASRGHAGPRLPGCHGDDVSPIRWSWAWPAG